MYACMYIYIRTYEHTRGRQTDRQTDRHTHLCFSFYTWDVDHCGIWLHLRLLRDPLCILFAFLPLRRLTARYTCTCVVYCSSALAAKVGGAKSLPPSCASAYTALAPVRCRGRARRTPGASVQASHGRRRTSPSLRIFGRFEKSDIHGALFVSGPSPSSPRGAAIVNFRACTRSVKAEAQRPGSLPSAAVVKSSLSTPTQDPDAARRAQYRAPTRRREARAV